MVLEALLLIKQEYKMYTPNDLIPSIFSITWDATWKSFEVTGT